MDEKSTEEGILEAAGIVLAEHGYDGFTTQAIADEAGVSQGLVHYYFETKQELLLRLFEWGSEDVAAEVESRVTEDDPRNKLIELADYMINGGENFEEALDVARISLELRHQAVHNEELRTVFERERSQLPELVNEIVREGINDDMFREVDPEAFTEVYLGAIESGEYRRAIFADPDACKPVFQGLTEIVDTLLVKHETERSTNSTSSTVTHE